MSTMRILFADAHSDLWLFGQIGWRILVKYL